MMSGFSSSSVIDPLNADCQLPSECYSSEQSELEDEQGWDPLSTQPPMADERSVLQWTVDDVKVWLQENIPFGHDQMQEHLRLFQEKAIDGLALLTLQRKHSACIGMNDFDWLQFKAARKRLVSGSTKITSAQDMKHDTNGSWTSSTTPRKGHIDITPPDSPDSFRLSCSGSSGIMHSYSRPISRNSSGITNSQESFMFPTPKRLFSFPRITWGSNAAKDEQIELLTAEVQSLRGEIVRAEERGTTLQAQMQHLDNLLRTSLLAGYLYTRTRWVPLTGEPLIEDDVDVDDWLQRFLVLKDSSIFFYVQATDLRPQGTILLDDIVEVGVLPVQLQCQNFGEQWFSFYITTCTGLRLECSTQLKLQMDSWLTILGGDMKASNSLPNHTPWNENELAF